MALWYMVPVALASEGARSRGCRRGCLSTGACSFDQARVCFRRKHMRTQRCEKAEVKGPIPQDIKGLPGLLFRERSRASSKEAKSG
jgi:hypothetical protein